MKIRNLDLLGCRLANIPRLEADLVVLVSPHTVVENGYGQKVLLPANTGLVEKKSMSESNQRKYIK
jgi:hypothetical protein